MQPYIFPVGWLTGEVSTHTRAGSNVVLTLPYLFRAHVGNSQHAVWNTANLGNCHRKKYICTDEGQNEVTIHQHQDISLPQQRRETPPRLTTNGKSESISTARTSVLQELTELEKQIEIIKQELQFAIVRKSELEEYARTSRTAEP